MALKKFFGALGGALLGGPIGAGVGYATGGDIGKAMGTKTYKPQFDQSIEDEQSNLSAYLKSRATGESPSLAQAQTTRALRDTERQGIQAIRSMGSVSPALRQRLIAQRQAQTGAEIATRGGEAELAERFGAQQGLADLLQARRKQRMEEEQLRSGAFAGAMEQRAGLWRGLGSAGATMMGKA